jgi:hypothetical protein
MASTPSILITGSTSGAGTAGQSKTDCVAGETITLSDSANASGTYAWELWTVDGSAVTLTGANTATPTFTAAADESYLAFVSVDGVKSYSVNAAGERISSQGGIAVLTGTERAPVPGETDQFGGWNTPLDNILADYRAGALGGGGGGGVTGPGSSTDNAVARFNGAGGSTIQNSGVIIDDSNNVSGIVNITLTGTVDGRDVATDGTKLDGIEALADVTDATNVAAAGAVMDSDFSGSSGIMRKTGAGAYVAADTIDAGVGTTITTVADGANLAIDCSKGNSFAVTLGGNRTVDAPTNARNGQTVIFKIIQDGTGSRTLTWNATFNWPSGTAPTLSTAASSVDIVSMWFDGSNWYCTSSLNFS